MVSLPSFIYVGKYNSPFLLNISHFYTTCWQSPTMLLSLWCWHDDWRRCCWSVSWPFWFGFLPGMCTLFEVSHALLFSSEVSLPTFRHMSDVFMICIPFCLFSVLFFFFFLFILGIMIALCLPVIRWTSCGYSADFSSCRTTFVRSVSSSSCIIVRPVMYSRKVSLTVYEGAAEGVCYSVFK